MKKKGETFIFFTFFFQIENLKMFSSSSLQNPLRMSVVHVPRMCSLYVCVGYTSCTLHVPKVFLSEIIGSDWDLLGFFSIYFH